MQRVAIICLGAFGDCCNALPLARYEFQEGNHVTFYISKEFASLLDGVTYCEREVWPGPYHECLKAAENAEQSGKYDRIMVVQCYGTPIERQTDSFCKEAWRAVGKLHLWGKLPLAFDNRNKIALSDTMEFIRLNSNGRPLLLVSHSGKSSPFPLDSKISLLSWLYEFKDKFLIFDISDYHCEHFYDLLNLYEISACLITTDSGPLHLANAVPKLPVIALITDRPDNWHGSPAQPNHILRIRYGEFQQSKDKIVQALNGVLTGHPPQRTTVMFHVWNDYDRTDDGNQHRHGLSKLTWEKQYNANPAWVSYPVHDRMLNRSSLNVGERRSTPFIKDVIGMAAHEARPEDILVFTNDDSLMLPEFTEIIKSTVGGISAIWGARWELPTGAEQKWGNPKGYRHCGADVFAFTKQWWSENEKNFPDFLIGYEAWDLCLRMLIEMTGGIQVEGLVAHFIHQPVWHSAEHREGPGNIHNRRLFQQWLANRNLKWPSP